MAIKLLSTTPRVDVHLNQNLPYEDSGGGGGKLTSDIQLAALAVYLQDIDASVGNTCCLHQPPQSLAAPTLGVTCAKSQGEELDKERNTCILHGVVKCEDFASRIHLVQGVFKVPLIIRANRKNDAIVQACKFVNVAIYIYIGFS